MAASSTPVKVIGRSTWQSLLLPAQCPNRCDALLVRRDLLSHLTTGCQLRLSACKFCNLTYFQVEVTEHEDSCPEATVACQYCLQEGIKRKELPAHAGSCAKTPKPCPLQQYGCNFSGLADAIDSHLDVKNHVACFQQLHEREQERDIEIRRLKSELDSCKRELSSCRSELDSCRSELDSCKNELTELADGGINVFETQLHWITQVPDHEKGE